ncbi:NUDIX hydrolase [Rhizobium leguminosarum]|uniref:NUDIX hydrolase n=1 Tax=Rhizobium leguminosarum TaxID=384 RepID=UPI001FDEC0D2|nr:NUDIX hydrolase [Rhizobium leguminosarum]
MSYLSRLAEYADAMFHGSTAHRSAARCCRKSENDGMEVLLITTRETKRWTIPKGWPVKGLDPHQAAKREAWEEAGVKGKAKKKPFGYFTYVKTLADGHKVPSVVQVHLLETRATRSHFPERGQRDLVWLPASEAALLADEPELKGLLGKFSRRTAFR